MHPMDFTTWQTALTTLIGLAVFTLLGVGIRILVMQTVQQRRERMNRQINERLKTLIGAYRTLGGSFTGRLTVDPTHLRELRVAAQAEMEAMDGQGRQDAETGSDRSRRIRDAVEAALADILLLGTEEQCRMASQAANDMAAGRPIHTAELVVSLRNFIRAALDLEPIPAEVAIPLQGPTRTQGGAGRKGGAERSGGQGGGQGGGRGGNAGGAGGADPMPAFGQRGSDAPASGLRDGDPLL